MRDAVGALGGELVRLVPALASLLGPTPEPGEIDPGQRQHRFFAVASAFLASIGTEESPLVLFLDDVQWADEGSLELLAHLVRTAGETRALAVLAVGSDPGEREGPARALGAISARPPRPIALAPLDGPAIRAVVTSMLGEPPAEVVELVEE